VGICISVFVFFFFSFWCFFPKRDDFGFVDEAGEAATTSRLNLVLHPTSTRTDASVEVRQCKFHLRKNESNIGGNVQTSRLINKKSPVRSVSKEDSATAMRRRLELSPRALALIRQVG